MKTNAIIRIVIWSLVIVILLGLLAAGFALRAYYTTRDVKSWHEGAAETDPAISRLPKEETLRIPADSIQEIEIEWVAGDIILLPDDVTEITVSESDVPDSKYAMVWKHRGGTLEISHCEDNAFSIVGIHSDDYMSKDLTIKVPRDWQCGSLQIDAADATLEVRDLTIREVDFDGASGACEFVNCDIGELDIDTASGDVTFSGTLKTLDFDAASASFIGDFRNTPGRIDMDGMSGSLDIALPEDCGYSLSMDGVSSSFRSDFQGTKMQNGYHVYGDGRCVIQVDGMSCDVTIRKTETP